MKSNRIIVGILVLIGFGSCANRPSKSKPADNPQADSVSVVGSGRDLPPTRVMYGSPARPFRPPQDEVPAKRVDRANPEAPAVPAESAQPAQPSRK